MDNLKEAVLVAKTLDNCGLFNLNNRAALGGDKAIRTALAYETKAKEKWILVLVALLTPWP